MRSRAEITFRVRQEIGNLWQLLSKPKLPDGLVGQASWPAGAPSINLHDASATPLPHLPDPIAIAQHLRGTPYAAELVGIAESILDHRFPLLAFEIETGPEVAWRQDYVHHVASGTRYFRFVPYLDFHRVGDHKLIWELNRHQHWVLLAQAFLLSGRADFLEEIWREFESWLRQNPFLRGINWASSLEVAFRALSWTWVYHLAGCEMETSFRRRFLNELYRHGCYIERNLSTYFSPNTHLLGEAVALHALGAAFPGFPNAQRWVRTGAALVSEQMDSQVREDGTHFEESSYYHVYALDMFLFHSLLAETTAAYRAKLGRMAAYLSDLLGPMRRLPFLSDDDGGRLFHPYGARDAFGRASIAACAIALGHNDWPFDIDDACEVAVWWLGPDALEAMPARRAGSRESKLYTNAGVAILQSGKAQVVVDAGPFGASTGGHSHSDTLGVVVRRGAEELLVDPGTFTYVSDPHWRDWFRSAAAHNTVRIDGRDQAVANGPFGWFAKPDVRIFEWSVSAERDFLDAACLYGAFRHRRRVLFLKPDRLVIHDVIEGPPGDHLIEQFWHTGERAEQVGRGAFRIGSRAVLVVAGDASPQGPGKAEIFRADGPGEPNGIGSAQFAAAQAKAADGKHDANVELSEGGQHGWRSRGFGNKTPSPVIRVSKRTALPVTFLTMLDFRGNAEIWDVQMLCERFETRGERSVGSGQ